MESVSQPHETSEEVTDNLYYAQLRNCMLHATLRYGHVLPHLYADEVLPSWSPRTQRRKLGNVGKI